MKLLYDWVILPPAVFIDYVLFCLFGLSALVAPSVAWHCTVKLIESDELTWRDYPARPKRALSWVAAVVITTYVTLVCLTAVSELPRIFYTIARTAEFSN